MSVLHPDRLLRAPRVSVVEPLDRSPVAAGPSEVALRVDGLVCSVCAARTASALRRVPGVEDARVDLAAGQAHVRLAPGVVADEVAMQGAVERVVVGMRARRWLERAAGGGQR
ncbi:MAG: heavy metal-associated domain-containing protein [Dehalococcoidia bacterium]|nr:heavy metal-associated domain-containing protein [Dehalococcoidia bacterium]